MNFWKWLNQFIKPCRHYIYNHVIDEISGKTLKEELSLQGYLGGSIPAMNAPSFRRAAVAALKTDYCPKKNMPFKACFKR